jgi:hypothetical protein
MIKIKFSQWFLCHVPSSDDLNVVFSGMSGSDHARFQALSGCLDFQHQAMAHGLAQHAEERRKEIEKEMAAKAAEPMTRQQ